MFVFLTSVIFHCEITYMIVAVNNVEQSFHLLADPFNSI